MAKKKIELTDEQLLEASIPRRFWTPSRAEYFGDENALGYCEHYVTNSKHAYRKGLGVFLRGLPDSGKTWLMTYMMRCLMGKGYKVYYTTLDDITDWIFRPEVTERFSTKFLEADFVGLDAVNTLTGGTEAAFRKFVKLRTDNAMPIIAATSMTMDKNLFGDQDPFIDMFKAPGQKLVNTSITVNCSVNEFRIDKHYRKQKEGFQK